jgi:hypothetical protein
MVHRINNEKDGFAKWWNVTSSTLIGGLISILFVLCAAIIGFNFSEDAKLHSEVKILREEQRENFQRMVTELSELKALLLAERQVKTKGEY